jgi:hypothetical protein
MNECGGWRQIMPEKHGFFKRAWYIIQLIVLSVFYFFYAIFGGAYEWIKNKLK